MMNRRNFLKLVGSAYLGTLIPKILPEKDLNPELIFNNDFSDGSGWECEPGWVPESQDSEIFWSYDKPYNYKFSINVGPKSPYPCFTMDLSEGSITQVKYNDVLQTVNIKGVIYNKEKFIEQNFTLVESPQFKINSIEIKEIS